METDNNKYIEDLSTAVNKFKVDNNLLYIPIIKSISDINSKLDSLLLEKQNIITKNSENNYTFNFTQFKTSSGDAAITNNNILDYTLLSSKDAFVSDSDDYSLYLDSPIIQNEIGHRITFYNEEIDDKDNIYNCKYVNSEQLLQLFSEINENKMLYKCKYCDERFSKASALGGHTSKKHAEKTKLCTEKVFTKKIRKTEVERQNFLKKL